MNDKPALQGTNWWVEDIAGNGVIDMSHTTYQAMEKVSHWEIAETGLLHLHDPETKSLIRASKIDK